MKVNPVTYTPYLVQHKGDLPPKDKCIKPSLDHFNEYPPVPIETLKAYNVNFEGYYCELKRLYKKGLIKVKYSFYGGKLNPKKLSIEHIIPRSKGGKNCQSNYVLVNSSQNSDRGNSPLNHYIDWEAVGIYLKQFEGIKVKNFDGDQYIKDVIASIDEAIHNGY